MQYTVLGVNAVGDRVTVLYLKDAQDPSMTWAKIDTPGALWFEEIHLVGLGVAMTIVGLYNRHLHKSQSITNTTLPPS